MRVKAANTVSQVETLVSGTTSDITDTTTTLVIAAPGANFRNLITHLIIQNSHATVSTWVTLKDGLTGATLYNVYCAAGGAGASITFPSPIKQSQNTALYVVCGTSGANVRASASGYMAQIGNQ